MQRHYFKLQLLRPILILAFFLMPSLSSASDLTRIQREDGCAAYFPEHFTNQINFKGPCLNGLAHGSIDFSTPNSSGRFTNRAQFSGGYVEGELSLNGANTSFKCNFRRSLRHGYCIDRAGTYRNLVTRFDSGQELEGSGFKEVVLGSGDESRQEGEFVNGKLNGYGRMIFSTKSKELRAFEQAAGTKWRTEGNRLIAEGIWEDGILQRSCESRQTCSQLITNQQAAESISNQRRQQCEATRQTCEASCGLASYWTGSKYVENQSWSSCRSKCTNISCN